MGFQFLLRVCNVTTLLLCVHYSHAGKSRESPETFSIKPLRNPSTVFATSGPSDKLLDCSSLEDPSDASSTQGNGRLCQIPTDVHNNTQPIEESKYPHKKLKINAKFQFASKPLSSQISNTFVQNKSDFSLVKFGPIVQIKRSSSGVAGSIKARVTKRQARPRGSSCGNWTLNPRRPLPWDCRPVKQWISLSSNYYPTYLQKTICSHSSCWYGHFNCTAVTQVINLLTRCDGVCVEEDDRVPSSLRSNWIFTNYELQVGCACTT